MEITPSFRTSWIFSFSQEHSSRTTPSSRRRSSYSQSEHLSVGRVNVPNDALGNQTHIFAVAAVERLCEASRCVRSRYAMDSEQTFWTSRMSSKRGYLLKICRTSLREISSATVFRRLVRVFQQPVPCFRGDILCQPRSHLLSRQGHSSQPQIAGKPIERAAVAQNSQATAVSAV